MCIRNCFTWVISTDKDVERSCHYSVGNWNRNVQMWSVRKCLIFSCSLWKNCHLNKKPNKLAMSWVTSTEVLLYFVFVGQSPEEVFMEIRRPLEWHCKQMDHFVGLNFNSNFNFALVGHLLKGKCAYCSLFEMTLTSGRKTRQGIKGPHWVMDFE